MKVSCFLFQKRNQGIRYRISLSEYPSTLARQMYLARQSLHIYKNYFHCTTKGCGKAVIGRGRSMSLFLLERMSGIEIALSSTTAGAGVIITGLWWGLVLDVNSVFAVHFVPGYSYHSSEHCVDTRVGGSLARFQALEVLWLLWQKGRLPPLHSQSGNPPRQSTYIGACLLLIDPTWTSYAPFGYQLSWLGT